MITGNTILITGGGSGVGLELAKRLIAQNNIVLICGRDKLKLEAAQQVMPAVHTFACDLSKEAECQQLFDWVQQNHADCNLLVNNAALAHTMHFINDDHAYTKARLEFDTNVLAPIHLCKLFIPLLLNNKNPQIINMTTGLIYAPKATYPFYNATKAALHAFTQVLRMQVQAYPIKIVEVLLPAIDTPWHKGAPPKIAISVQKAVDELLSKLSGDQTEIKIAGVRLLYWISRCAPNLASKIINAQ